MSERAFIQPIDTDYVVRDRERRIDPSDLLDGGRRHAFARSQTALSLQPQKMPQSPSPSVFLLNIFYDSSGRSVL
jgi:hypothetical protein